MFGTNSVMTFLRIDFVSGVVGRQQVVGELRRGLRRPDLGRVDAEVDPGDRLALLGQIVRLVVGQPARVGEPVGDVLVLGQVRAGVRFSGAETIPMTWSRPSEVLPRLTTCIRSLALSS